MSPEMERLIGRAVTDKQFRHDLVNDPEGTIKSSGLSLTPDEVDSVKRAAKQVSDQQALDTIDSDLDQIVQASGSWG